MIFPKKFKKPSVNFSFLFNVFFLQEHLGHRGSIRSSSIYSETGVTSDEWIDLEETDTETYYDAQEDKNPFIRASNVRQARKILSVCQLTNGLCAKREEEVKGKTLLLWQSTVKENIGEGRDRLRHWNFNTQVRQQKPKQLTHFINLHSKIEND